MGYDTKFNGVLRFTHEPTAEQLAALNAMFGEDARDHPEWRAHGGDGLAYIDLALSRDFGGIQWDDATEKTRDLPECVNMVIGVMRQRWPEFGLSGKLSAQGEVLEDRWELTIGDDGWASRVDTPPTGAFVTCPHCRLRFVVGEEGDDGR